MVSYIDSYIYGDKSEFTEVNNMNECVFVGSHLEKSRV